LISASTSTAIAGLAATLVPLAWGLFIHSDSRVVQTASEVKGSDGLPAVKIMVAPTAPQPLLDLATDTSVPEIVHAASVAPAAPPPKDPIYPPPDRGPYDTKRRQS
jgi:hypothetical protein